MAQFDYFVVFAEMRTGSNFLETNLNAIDGLACHGEAFNPHFIGYPNSTEVLGVDQATRDHDPKRLLREIRKTPDDLSGFRYFHDHDPRIFDKIVDDPKCAKIVLTRLCCTNQLRDSLYESSVVAGGYEQLVPYEVQDQELAFVQHGAKAARFAINLV